MKSQGATKNAANNAAQAEVTASAQDTKPVEKIDFSNVKIQKGFK